MKNFKNKIIAGGISLLMAFSASSFATNSYKAPVETNAVVKYVGETDKGLVFNLKFQNTAKGKIELLLKNEDGAILFENTFSEKELDKKIVFTNDNNAKHLTFIIKTSQGEIVQHFTIRTKTVQTVDVQPAD